MLFRSRQANAIANAVGDTLENNGNWNPLCRLPFGVNYGCFTGDGYPIEWNQRFRGYFCWDWARAFYRAIQSVNASCFDIDLEFAGFPDTTGRMHVWVKITSKCTGGSFYVDDGFGTGTYGNFDTPCGHYPYVGTCSPSSLPDSWHRPTPYGPDMNPLK